MVITMNPRVYLLARLVDQSKMKFKMWCKYHENLGFHKIYIFVKDEPDWFQEAKKEIIADSDRFIFIKADERWRKVSEIVKAFCKHCGNTIPEDAVICTHSMFATLLAM